MRMGTDRVKRWLRTRRGPKAGTAESEKPAGAYLLLPRRRHETSRGNGGAAEGDEHGSHQSAKRYWQGPSGRPFPWGKTQLCQFQADLRNKIRPKRSLFKPRSSWNPCHTQCRGYQPPLPTPGGKKRGQGMPTKSQLMKTAKKLLILNKIRTCFQALEF